ncbi:putative serine/threonine protein kinase [Cedratvirus lausannensis]|uniref:Putative serine/threonine protein kinase n=1 Tax=Cedratvirus lausannensis TaxID=2023205 RepID=A0A285Q1R7_9VIRU|nr:putative serine/threonine protein kinase [Cedratvirus lausannensis]
MMWGSYSINKCLGKGLYGEVREARGADGKRYAIKKFLLDFDCGVEAPQELALVLQCSHPYIIQGKEYFFYRDEQYLVMELAETNLLKYVKENKLTEGEMCRLFYELVSALAYLQENGFYHCDIKPENVLIKDGHAKLADFGVSGYKSIQPECCNSFASPQNYFVNHRLYRREMPEKHVKIFTQKVDYQASDIWALGVTFVYILTGKVLFYDASNPLQELYKYVDAPASYLSSNCTNLSEPGIHLLEKMLHPDQEQRIKLAKDILQFLPNYQGKELVLGSAPIFYNLDIKVTSDKKLSILVDWLKESSKELGLSCLDLTASIDCLYYVYDDLTDKGQNNKIIQCVGCACVLLMSKTYNSVGIAPSELVYYSDGAFTKTQLYEQERKILHKLQGRVFFNTPALLG